MPDSQPVHRRGSGIRARPRSDSLTTQQAKQPPSKDGGVHVGWGDPDLYLERGKRKARARTWAPAILRYIVSEQIDWVRKQLFPICTVCHCRGWPLPSLSLIINLRAQQPEQMRKGPSMSHQAQQHALSSEMSRDVVPPALEPPAEHSSYLDALASKK